MPVGANARTYTERQNYVAMELALLPCRPRVTVTAGFMDGCNGFMLVAVCRIKYVSLWFVHRCDTETHTNAPPCLCVCFVPEAEKLLLYK